jgi:O-antigen/teichoic acid export membrane protein
MKAGRNVSSTNVRRGALSVLDQIVCSASSFVTVVILSRSLLPADLGTYALIFNAVVILGGLQQGFVTGPYRVLGAPKGFAPDYVAAQAGIQSSLLVVEAVMLAAFLHWCLAVDGPLVSAAVAALAFLQLHEFVRTLLMTRLSVARLLAIDVLTHGVRLAGLWVLHELGALTVVSALAWLAASALVAASQLQPRWVRGGLAADVWRANWRFGRWLLVETVAHLIATRSYIYVVGAMLGREEVAAFSASQNVANAVNVIVMGLTAAAIPIAKLKLEREGYQAWKAWLTTVAVAMFVASGSAFAAVAVFARPLIEWLYPTFYAPFAPLVIVLALGVWLDAMGSNLTSAFWTAERPDLNVVGKIAAAAVALVWAYPGIHAFGLYGAGAGLVITPVICLVASGLLMGSGALSQKRVGRLQASSIVGDAHV